MAAEPGRAGYWDDVYRTRGADSVSWFQPEPYMSLELIDRLGVAADTAVVDIGGGASLLADRLVGRGFTDLTVLDVSGAALGLARRRLGDGAPVRWVQHDVLSWAPGRRFGLWHDRAVFHFLTDAAEREAYLGVLERCLEPGGGVVLATFAADGPEYCSGLPVARYDPDQLSATLGRRYRVVAEERELHVTPAGATQSFTWIAARRDDQSPGGSGH